MELCGTSNTGFQNEAIIEENLTANYIEKVSTRKEYIEKFREYKKAYRKKWRKVELNPDEKKYKEDVNAFIEDMKPFNRRFKNDEISKKEYMNILNKRKDKTIY